MIFASRLSREFISPDEVIALERWSGKGVLEALIGLSIPADVSNVKKKIQIRALCQPFILSEHTKNSEAFGSSSKKNRRNDKTIRRLTVFGFTR
jgi:hypothetical protein